MSFPVARILMVLGATAALAAGSAQAGAVQWSVGIHAPVAPGVSLGTVISNRHAAPVWSAPVYVPASVYVPRVVYAPTPVYAAPAPVWINGRWVHRVHHRNPHRPGWQHHRGDHAVVAPSPLHRPGREIRY